MMEETQQQIWATAKPSKSPVCPCANLFYRFRGRVSQFGLDVAVAILFRVQIRTVRRQPFHDNLWVARSIALDFLRPVGLQPIPNNNQAPQGSAAAGGPERPRHR